MGRSSKRRSRRARQQANVYTLPTTLPQYLSQLARNEAAVERELFDVTKRILRKKATRPGLTFRYNPPPDRKTLMRWKIAELKERHRRGLFRPVTDTRPTRAKLAAAGAVTVAQRASVCVGRSQRKEVMFATNKAGRVGQKSPVWTKKSKVRC